MQLRSFAIACLCLIACNNPESTTTTTESSADAAPINMHGYSANYSSSFKTGNPKNTETILELYRAYDDNNLDKARSLFSDSVFLYFADGNSIVNTADSMFEMMKSYRNNYSSVETQVNAVVGVTSTDKNEDWVLIWSNEKKTGNDGKVDSTQLQETWGLDKNGKARILYQYSQHNNPE